MYTGMDYVRAMWCVDSETSREYLIDLDTQEIIAERVDGKIVDPNQKDNGGEAL